METCRLYLLLMTVSFVWCVPASKKAEKVQREKLTIPGDHLNPDDFKRAEEYMMSGRAMEDFKSYSEEDEMLTADDIIPSSTPRTIKINPSAVPGDNKYIWENGIVPYTIDEKITFEQRMVLCIAMSEFYNRTCIKFVPRTTETDYVSIVSGPGCRSHVGRVGGMQELYLEAKCFRLHQTVMHEIMHILSFIHEQNRPDRDQFIEVMWDNIVSNMQHNFWTCDEIMCDTLGSPYDAGSITHYGPNNFAIDKNKPTLKWIGPGNPTYGQRKDLSRGDLDKINRLYKCNSLKPHGDVIVVCQDMADECLKYKTRGLCKPGRLTSFIQVYCRKTCKLCNQCEDAYPGGICKKWANEGSCQTEKYLAMMTLYCAKSCNTCVLEDTPVCWDVNQNDCRKMADKGKCETNPYYMSEFCAKTCKTCATAEYQVQLILDCVAQTIESLMGIFK